MPTLGSRPHDPEPGPGGTIWWTGMFANVLGRFDPKTKAFASTKIPSGGGVVRNMVATKDGKLYLACSGVNKVAIAEIR